MAKSKKFYTTKIESTEPDCEACGLSAVCKSPKLKFIGKGKKNVLIIGSQPTSREDLKGELGYGDEAVFLESALEEIGIDFYEDCFYCTTVGCRPPRDRRPGTAELKACRKRLNKIIERLDPSVLILLGKEPFNAIVSERISGRLTGTAYNEFFGCVIADQEIKRHILCTWDIKFMLSTKTYNDGGESKPLYQRDSAWFRLWKSHLKDAFNYADTPVEVIDYNQFCKTTQDVNTAIDWIYEALDWPIMAWDVEANAKKLHRKGSKVYCASISNGKVSYAFPMFENPDFKKAWKRLMLSDVKKIAHNLQYENESQKNCNGYWVNNWYCDTMLNAHIEHHQRRTGLKFCVYTEFGVLGYDDKSDFFITKSDEDESVYGNNCFNNIDKAPMEELLQYNALDSLFTFKLYERQWGRMADRQKECALFYAKTAVTLSKTTNNGFYVKEENFEATAKILKESLSEKEAEIMSEECVKLWDGEEPFSFTSTKQLGHLLFDIMGIKPVAYTDKGTPSLDKEALEKMNVPILKKIVEYRELDKMCSTYIDGWKREAVDGVVHSQFLLNSTDTGRSSSTGPNSQNSYKRDKKKKKIVRSIICARKDCRIVEWDAHGQETYVNMYYSKDPNYKKYLTVAGSDMHLDLATRLFMLPKEEITKDYRQVTKSQTFALTYGSYYAQVAKDMWEYFQGNPVAMQHLRSKGVTSYEQYEKVVEEAEKYFWTEMFGVHDKWRKKMWKQYLDTGVIETYTGFKLEAPLDRKCTFNYPPQGTGAQITFWIMNHLQDKIEELGLKTMLIGEVHDSVVASVPGEEEAIMDYWVHQFACVEIQKEWKWISIPLVMEKERSAINGTWSEMFDCGGLTGELAEPKDPEERKR